MLQKLYVRLLCLCSKLESVWQYFVQKMSNENCLLSSACLSLELTGAWTSSDGSCWATCKCNILCLTSYTEINLWKRPTVIASKLFSSYFPPVFSTGSSRDSKTSDLNRFYEALVWKEALAICQDRVFASFLCALSLSSVLWRFIHLY